MARVRSLNSPLRTLPTCQRHHLYQSSAESPKPKVRPFHLVKRHDLQDENLVNGWLMMVNGGYRNVGSRDRIQRSLEVSGSHPGTLPAPPWGPVTAATPLRRLHTAASASCGSPVCFAHRCLKFGANKMTLKITIKDEGKWWWTDGFGIHFQTHSISADICR